MTTLRQVLEARIARLETGDAGVGHPEYIKAVKACSLEQLEFLRGALAAPDPAPTALTELEGFSKRNVERARKALDFAMAEAKREGYGMVQAAEQKPVVEASARLHEAVRIYQVIKMRAQEALK